MVFGCRMVLCGVVVAADYPILAHEFLPSLLVLVERLDAQQRIAAARMASHRVAPLQMERPRSVICRERRPVKHPRAVGRNEAE